jgi:imidazolonepropionase-like amidohydrolase
VLALRGATLIDGTGAPPIPNSLLVYSEGRVVSVGTATREAVQALPRGTHLVAADGKWIIPGLIDSHVHAESDEDLKTMLWWGVTSVRLMAEDVATAQTLAAASRDRPDIPEVFPAAPIFTRKGGWWGRDEPVDRNVDRYADTPAAARVAVRKANALGSREIKIMWDDMGWCRDPLPRLKKIDRAVAGALIEEARREGMRAIVHAPELADAKDAIAAGATALAHGVVGTIDDATVAVMKSRPVFYVPTMDIFEFLADTRAFVDSVLSDPRASGALPADTLEKYRSAAYSDGYRRRYPNNRALKERLPALVDNLRRLHAAGVPVALGTDMWAFPGLGVSIEMDLYARSGLTPLQVIRTATQTAARSLGLEKDRGTLEPGRRADFVVLTADPMADVRNVRAIAAVYKAGRPAYRKVPPFGR